MSTGASRWQLPAGIMGIGAVVLVLGWFDRPVEAEAETAAETAADTAQHLVAAQASSTAPATPVPEPEALVVVNGADIYNEHCATCHMGDGSGVPNFQPPIAGSPVVAAGRDRLEAVIRAGSAALQDRPNTMGWQMPPFGFLTDPEVEALVGYVTDTFGSPPQE
ncbi:c-type cytochrome [Synoicihabitans lomoniglobus]|uniref:Cytochrome c n=1 Tax=Synoicihabitans lomoniglobus TaxID=2909285 RepID=A0AAF0CQC3_9BACT|nr:cytochrome c [Opitutaceae bacterium LMO-M01]WED66081.1 cytochrome c [Opitutaceae bacterium LMO-M01]